MHRGGDQSSEETRIGDVKREKAHRQSIETEWGGTLPKELIVEFGIPN